MTKLLKAKKIIKDLKPELKARVAKLKVQPTLAIVLLSSDPSSKKYVEIKQKVARKLGIKTVVYENANATYKQAKKLIQELNNNSAIYGILLQLPLNKDLQKYTTDLVNIISPNKDVDGLTNYNLGKLVQRGWNLQKNLVKTVSESSKVTDTSFKNTNKTLILPPAIKVFNYLVEFYKIDLTNKNIVVIGQGKVIGKPLSVYIGALPQIKKLLIVPRKINNLGLVLQDADIIISATGNGYLLNRGNTPRNSIIIDYGTSLIDLNILSNNKTSLRAGRQGVVYSGASSNKVFKNTEIDTNLQEKAISAENNKHLKLAGDANYKDLIGWAEAITPTPGGTGPLTVYAVLENLINMVESSK